MIQPGNDVLKAITNLDMSNPTSFKVFMDWLQASWMGHLMILAITEKDPQRGWMQGRCQELRDLIQFITSAETQLSQARTVTAAAEEQAVNKFD